MVNGNPFTGHGITRYYFLTQEPGIKPTVLFSFFGGHSRLLKTYNMNYMQDKLQFETFEEGIENLKKAVEIRDKMGGAMYWSILNEDCCEIANAISQKFGGRKAEIGDILGEGNYV